jgi:hypothetical protein
LELKNIATALVKAQREFGPALKTSINPHFRSRYADLSMCVEAVLDALNNNGIFLLQKNYENSNGIMVETIFVHESGEMLECGRLYFPASKNDPQGFMSALTYGRRASLMAACGIAPEDDDGNAATRPAKASINASTMAAHIADIADSANSEELNKAYALAYAACEGDASWQAKVIAAKKARIEKAKQEKVQANG